jgi:DNA-binding CsgD family transcriptional regulator
MSEKTKIDDYTIDVFSYLEKLAPYVTDDEKKRVGKTNFTDLNLRKDQAAYIIDYKINKVTIHEGFKNLLGYDDSEVNLKLITNDYLKPCQRHILSILINASIYSTTQNKVTKGQTLTVVQKVEKKNGEFITVIRRTHAWETDTSGKLISALSILTDLTGILDNEAVKWKWNGPIEVINNINELTNNGISRIFTNREKEILYLLKEDKSSKEIADELFLSKHTVDTHRRNMLKKAGAKNTIDLVKFATLNNII